MWPFSSDKSSEELAEELPPNLRQFYASADPLSKNSHVLDNSKDAKVQKVLAKQSGEYDGEFERFKHQHPLRTAAAINCAEVQQAVVDCLRGWSFVTGNECSAQISRTSSCMDTQQRAFKKLHYNDCYSRAQCLQISAIVDSLFVKHFGRYAELTDESALEKFEVEIENAFDTVWR